GHQDDAVGVAGGLLRVEEPFRSQAALEDEVPPPHRVLEEVGDEGGVAGVRHRTGSYGPRPLLHSSRVPRVLGAKCPVTRDKARRERRWITRVLPRPAPRPPRARRPPCARRSAGSSIRRGPTGSAGRGRTSAPSAW